MYKGILLYAGWLIVYLALLLDTGGIYARSTCLLLAAVLFAWLFRLRSRKGNQEEAALICCPPRADLLLTVVILVSGSVSTACGIDAGWSLYGLLRLGAMLLFAFTMQQLPDLCKNYALSALPWLGAAMVAAGAAGFAGVPLLSGWISETGRLAGPFAYPNTMALFLLLGFVVCVRGPIPITKDMARLMSRILFAAILAVGILLTGCRSVFLVFCGYAVYLMIRCIVRHRSPYVMAAVLASAAALIILVIAGGEVLPGIGRLTRISFGESTLQGRLLYWEDALRMLTAYPAGVGYMGYLYLQQRMQTGVYDVRFVHNELLQWMLDYGIAAGIAAALLSVRVLRNRLLSAWRKELLLLVLTCSLFDFHLQYWAVLLIVLTALPTGESTVPIRHLRALQLTAAGAAWFSVLLSVCVGMAAFCEARGDYAAAVRWNPLSTDLRTELMLNAEDLETAEPIADEILVQNEFVYAAWKIKANAAATRGDVSDFLVWEQEALSLKRYDTDEYEEYIDILLSLCLRAEDEETRLDEPPDGGSSISELVLPHQFDDLTEKSPARISQSGAASYEAASEVRMACIEAILEVPNLLMQVRQTTSIRAYLIDDLPNLTLSPEYRDLLDALEARYTDS